MKERLCRYVNDSTEGNSTMKLKIFDYYPRLCLYATRDIDAGEEVRYDYGDDQAPWRKVILFPSICSADLQVSF